MAPRSPLVPFARRILESCVSLLAPDVCAGCDERVGILRVFCPSCAPTLVPAGGEDADRIAAFVYGGALAAAITSFKYGGRVDRARPLSHLLLHAIAPLRAEPPTVVVPVPLHRARFAVRGYNQAALLARPVARALGARFAPHALERLRDTPAQATLGREARQRNVQRAFVVPAVTTNLRLRRRGDDGRGLPLAGERVLLIDDVRTTGATLEACATALRDAGAAHVASLVLAEAEG